jgi:small-conductance mechanosensitive channel
VTEDPKTTRDTAAAELRQDGGDGGGVSLTPPKDKAKVEQLKQQVEIKTALKQTGNEEETAPPVAQTRDKVWFGGYLLFLVALGGLYYLVTLRFLGLSDGAVYWVLRVARGAILLTLILGVAKASDVYLIGRIEDPVPRYNLRRIQRLIVGLLMAFVAVTMWSNWYTTIVSLGLISLILGFALQTPITSFIGWIYIMIRAPYRVGDRIKIGDATGDVIDVSYLDTTLWEFGGYLSTDHPSGRIIRFPNSEVLRSAVYNYTWPLFPYVWNEIIFNIAYESDLDFVANTMQAVAAEEVGEAMMERIRVYRELLAQTPVDALEVREHPSVLFRVSSNTWLEAIVRYLVHPKEAGRVKTRLIKKLLAQLNTAPDRVLFPKGNAR